MSIDGWTIELERRYQELKAKHTLSMLVFDWTKLFHGGTTKYFFGWSDDEIGMAGERLTKDVGKKNAQLDRFR